MTAQNQHPTIPGERHATPLTPEQRGWLVAALVAFIGVVFIGPAITAAAESSRAAGKRVHRKMRRLGGGAVDRVSAGVDRFRR